MDKTYPVSDKRSSLVVLAAICWGLSGGLGGLLMSGGWDPFVLALYRGAFGLLCALLWLKLRPERGGFRNPRLWFWSVVAGIGVAGNFAFYFVSISEGSVAVAATLMYCAPVFVFIASFALGLEPFTVFKGAAMVLVMLGIVLLTGIYNVGAAGITLTGVGAGLLSGLSYALFIFGFKYASPHGSPQAILAIAFGALVVALAWPGGTDQTLAALTSPSWPLFVALGLLGAGVSFILYIIGLNHTLPAVAAIVAMVEPVTAALFGVVVLKETLVGVQLAGMGLILLTVTALSVGSGGHAADQPEGRGEPGQ